MINSFRFYLFHTWCFGKQILIALSYNGVAGSNPAGGEILSEPKRRFIAQSLSCSPFHRLEMTEILLKGRKTLTHPSIFLTKIKTNNIYLSLIGSGVHRSRNRANDHGYSRILIFVRLSSLVGSQIETSL